MKRPALVLGIHPHTRGFGWVVFENPFSPYDWGMVSARQDKNAVCLRKLERLLERFEPEVLVLEAFEREHSARRGRISRLGQSIVALARVRRIEVALYSRGDVKACFANVGAITRQEIAEAVARQFSQLRHRLPPKRKPWQTAAERLSLFMAAALVLTHYTLGAEGVFETLQNAA
jgi:Holliday junction resolvasome RuvABC endonuclease subunit